MIKTSAKKNEQGKGDVIARLAEEKAAIEQQLIQDRLQFELGNQKHGKITTSKNLLGARVAWGGPNHPNLAKKEAPKGGDLKRRSMPL